MGIFDNFGTETIEEKARDFVGGFKVLDADIYESEIKMAFRHQSDSGALAIAFEFLLPNGETYKEDIYFTNAQGKHTYQTKDKKTAAMPGFVTVSNICMIATGKELKHQHAEQKVVKVYSSKEKAEVVADRYVLMDLIGKKVAIGLRKVLENKQEKNKDGKYVTVAATRETNKIHTIFHPVHKVTVNEAEAIAKAKAEQKTPPEPKAWEMWLKSNKGQVYDDRDIKDGGGGKSAESGGSTGERKKDDLFS